MSGAIVRVRFRDGVTRTYGPMTGPAAARRARQIRKLADDPRSDFKSARSGYLHGSASDLGDLIGRDGFALYGHDWRERVGS